MPANLTREAIDAAMMHGREKLALKPEHEMGISNFTLGKDKITGSRCFLNCCEESDDLGSQGSLLQMKQGCSAIDWSTNARTNTHKRTDTSWRQIFTPRQIPRPSFPVRDAGSDPRWSGNKTSHASDESILLSHPTHSANTEPVPQEVTL